MELSLSKLAAADTQARARSFKALRDGGASLPDAARETGFALTTTTPAQESRGASLVALLERFLPADGAERTAAVERMASAAGISASTVGQILRAEITCPPDQRLRGFAEALGVPVADLLAAAGRDGSGE